MSAYILLRAYTLLTFLYATFDICDLVSSGLGYSVIMASVVLGGETESGSVFAVARSSTAVTPCLINCNIVVALGVSVALDIAFTTFNMSLSSFIK